MCGYDLFFPALRFSHLLLAVQVFLYRATPAVVGKMAASSHEVGSALLSTLMSGDNDWPSWDPVPNPEPITIAV